MTRYSIFGYYGQGNAGDEAILSALVSGIKKTNPLAKIGVYSANPAETSSLHSVNAYSFFRTDIKSFIKGLLRRTRLGYVKSLFNFYKTDTVIIGGGGLFFDTPETNMWMFGYIHLINNAKIKGKKVVLMGISVGPLHHKSSETAIAEAFSKVDLISVRDESSKNLLIQCGVSSDKIHVIPDLVFTLESAPHSRITDILEKENFVCEGKKNIALTPCCYNSEKLGWIDQYASFIETAINQLNSNIWIVPMQLGEKHSDLTAATSIFNTLSEHAQKHTFILRDNYSAREIQGILSSSDFVLAERLHGTIMALNTSTPFLSIEYMPKVTGVLEQAGQSDRGIQMLDFLTGTFIAPTITAITNSFITSEAIENEGIKSNAFENFLLLRKVESI